MRPLPFCGTWAAARTGRTVRSWSIQLRMDRAVVPDALMREMRSSVIFLGAILARCKEATICYPGGCELGAASH